MLATAICYRLYLHCLFSIVMRPGVIVYSPIVRFSPEPNPIARCAALRAGQFYFALSVTNSTATHTSC